jgi:hypothetical protein
MKTLDTRDLDERKTELEGYRDTFHECQETLQEAEKALADFDPDNPNVAPDDEAWYEERDRLQEAIDDARHALDLAVIDFGDEEKAELEELETLESEISEWRHGEALIPVDDFEDYARELAEDLGYMDRKGADQWPFTCIDWEQAAEHLSQDYTTVSYQGNDYYVRS